jgi:hypothetical protein
LASSSLITWLTDSNKAFQRVAFGMTIEHPSKETAESGFFLGYCKMVT